MSAPSGLAPRQTVQRPVVVAGVCQNVGTSTVAAALAPRPVYDAGVYHSGHVDVLVCDDRLHNVRKAQRTVQQVIAQGYTPPLLVVVAHSADGAGSNTRGLLRMLKGHVRGVYQLPYVPSWPDRDDVPQLARELVTEGDRDG